MSIYDLVGKWMDMEHLPDMYTGYEGVHIIVKFVYNKKGEWDLYNSWYVHKSQMADDLGLQTGFIIPKLSKRYKNAKHAKIVAWTVLPKIIND